MIIGFNGAKGSGKNTAAVFVQEAEEFTGLNTTQWSFAEDLKWSAMNALKGQVYTPEEAVYWADIMKEDGYLKIGYDGPLGQYEYEITGREYLQWYGTEAHRDVFNQDFWVDNLLDKIPDTQSAMNLDLITDARFPNEAEAIQALDGVIIEIVRPELLGGDTHASEKPLPDYLVDYRIINQGSLAAFQKKVVDLVARII